MHAPAIPEWTAQELVRRIESGEEIHVLDVRAPFRLASGRIDILSAERFHNVPGSQVMAMTDPVEAGLPQGAPIAVVCGRGTDSRVVAGHLRAAGLEAASLSGGMISWMELAVPRAFEAPPGCDALIQFDRVGKGALAYAIVSAGEALVVDPPRHTDALLAAIREAGGNVTGVAETHIHADYISGGPALARELEVPYYLHPADASYPYDGTPAKIPFEAIEDGDEIAVGEARVRVLHTPGHTEGSVSYALDDHAVLTGDFIFVGSIGRPDLGGQAEAWARVLWRSVERARTEWPPESLLLPAHYAGADERNTDRSVGRTLGELARTNEPLGLPNEEAFLAWVLAKTGAFPESYRRIKAINIGLELPGPEEMNELEAGRNQCALG